VYSGADGTFVLYEDEGDSYNYEHGAHAEIALSWRDADRTLEIGARNGSFPGMLSKRTFRVVLVGPQRGVGIEATGSTEKNVEYDGHAVKVVLGSGSN